MGIWPPPSRSSGFSVATNDDCPWISEWIVASPRSPSPSAAFELFDVLELEGQPTVETERSFARLWVDIKIGRHYLELAAPRLGWDRATKRAEAGRVRVRRGDFGEVLATGRLLGAGIAVPVNKLRVQITPDQTQPGVDVVGMEMTPDGQNIERIHLVEAKFRSSRNLSAGVEAHTQLYRDAPDGFEYVLQFISSELCRTHDPLCVPFLDFLARREAASGVDRYHISLAWDRANWDEEVIRRLGEAAEIDPLAVHAIRISQLADLVERVLAHVADPTLMQAQPTGGE